MAKYDYLGREVPDPTPVSVPAGLSRPLSLQEEIKRFMRSEQMRIAAEAEGLETFEEADDFDVDEDPDPLSAYELPEAAPEAFGGAKRDAESLDGSPQKESPLEPVKPVSEPSPDSSKPQPGK